MRDLVSWWIWRWKHRTWFYRFTHNLCVECGKVKPMQGSTACRSCTFGATG